MVNRKKFKKGNNPPFVMIEHWILDTEAWGSLKPAPRALYFELKRSFKGFNNGKLFLSQRDASEKLNIGRDTVSRYFKELIDKGLLIETQGHCLGSEGHGKATHYALTELPLNQKPATKEFVRWKKTKSLQENPTWVARKSNIGGRKIQPFSKGVLENTTAFGQK